MENSGKAGPENHKSLCWISSGYPPDEIRFVANERRAPFLANDRRAFPRCSVHLIDWKRRSTLIGHISYLIRVISGGYPPEGLMIFRPWINSTSATLSITQTNVSMKSMYSYHFTFTGRFLRCIFPHTQLCQYLKRAFPWTHSHGCYCILVLVHEYICL